MFDHASIVRILGFVVILSPVTLLFVLGIASLLDRKPSEEATGRMCQASIVLGLLAALVILGIMLVDGTRHEAIEVGEWVVIHKTEVDATGKTVPVLERDEEGKLVPVPLYHFSVKLTFDRLSVPMAILSFLLCGTISAFAVRYMHREPGYNRFFVLYSMFVVGMVVTSLAGTIETLFAGWELVGLSSALLVAYFQERPSPVRNGLRVWIVYRISDAGLLLAAIALHHLTGEGDFDRLVIGGFWPDGEAAATGVPALVVGFLLILAAAGKSALVPFSGWLPRAMEGPTPSSAVFYGALSVHLGAFLLLRVSPILETSLWLAATVVVLGLSTALFAYLASSVQTDIKSALSYASLVQVGLIVAEIGIASACSAADPALTWLLYIPLIHLLGNACLRTLQFIRAPSLLYDYHVMENAIGRRLPQGGAPLTLPPGRFRVWLYRFALERGYLDALLNTFVVAPFLRFFRWCDGLERSWTDRLAGLASRESDEVKPHTGAIEDLP